MMLELKLIKTQIKVHTEEVRRAYFGRTKETASPTCEHDVKCVYNMKNLSKLEAEKSKYVQV